MTNLISLPIYCRFTSYSQPLYNYLSLVFISQDALPPRNIRVAGFIQHNLEHRYFPPHSGEQDEKGNVTLPPNISNNFDNGFLVGEIIRKITTDSGKKVPSALATVKQDASKNTKLTNWNFIWYLISHKGWPSTRLRSRWTPESRSSFCKASRRLLSKWSGNFTNAMRIRMPIIRSA